MERTPRFTLYVTNAQTLRSQRYAEHARHAARARLNHTEQRVAAGCQPAFQWAVAYVQPAAEGAGG